MYHSLFHGSVLGLCLTPSVTPTTTTSSPLHRSPINYPAVERTTQDKPFRQHLIHIPRHSFSTISTPNYLRSIRNPSPPMDAVDRNLLFRLPAVRDVSFPRIESLTAPTSIGDPNRVVTETSISIPTFLERIQEFCVHIVSHQHVRLQNVAKSSVHAAASCDVRNLLVEKPCSGEGDSSTTK
jgi:hypothetical protein